MVAQRLSQMDDRLFWPIAGVCTLSGLWWGYKLAWLAVQVIELPGRKSSI